MVLQKYFFSKSIFKRVSNGQVLRKSVFHIYFLCKREYESWRCAKEDQRHMEGGYEKDTEKIWKELLQTIEHVVP